MKESSRSEAALAAWEGEGGRVGGVSRDFSQRGHAPCLPSLPPGYEAQPVWGFHDRTGRFSYEFNRVYGPPRSTGGRGPVCRLDKRLSYWSVIWSATGENGDEHPAGRWMTYGHARTLPGSRLTYEQFSFPLRMREVLPELLHVGDVRLKPRPTVSSSPAELSPTSPEA